MKRRVIEPTCAAYDDCRGILRDLRRMGENGIWRWYEGQIESMIVCGATDTGWVVMRGIMQATVENLRAGNELNALLEPMRAGKGGAA